MAREPPRWKLWGPGAGPFVVLIWWRTERKWARSVANWVRSGICVVAAGEPSSQR